MTEKPKRPTKSAVPKAKAKPKPAKPKKAPLAPAPEGWVAVRPKAGSQWSRIIRSKCRRVTIRQHTSSRAWHVFDTHDAAGDDATDRDRLGKLLKRLQAWPEAFDYARRLVRQI